MGCSLLIILPHFFASGNHCASMAPDLSWHPSEVTMNGDLLKQGALSTGSDVNVIFRATNASWCILVHMFRSLILCKVAQYVALPAPLGIAVPQMRSVRDWAK